MASTAVSCFVFSLCSKIKTTGGSGPWKGDCGTAVLHWCMMPGHFFRCCCAIDCYYAELLVWLAGASRGGCTEAAAWL